MNFPILYTFRRCPYAMRARMALYHAKINYEHREILLKNRPKKLFEISPKGTVPVLDLLNGEVIDESFDIMKWAISKNKSETLFNRSKQKQIDLILLNDNQFKKWLDKYKYHVRHPENSFDFYRKNCEKILNKYEKALKDSKYITDLSREKAVGIPIYQVALQYYYSAIAHGLKDKDASSVLKALEKNFNFERNS